MITKRYTVICDGERVEDSEVDMKPLDALYFLITFELKQGASFLGEYLPEKLALETRTLSGKNTVSFTGPNAEMTTLLRATAYYFYLTQRMTDLSRILSYSTDKLLPKQTRLMPTPKINIPATDRNGARAAMLLALGITDWNDISHALIRRDKDVITAVELAKESGGEFLLRFREAIRA